MNTNQQAPEWAIKAAKELQDEGYGQSEAILTAKQLFDDRNSIATIIAEHAPAQSVNERLVNAATRLAILAESGPNGTGLRYYLNYQFPTTQGHMPLDRMCEQMQEAVVEVQQALSAAESSPSLEKELAEALREAMNMLARNHRYCGCRVETATFEAFTCAYHKLEKKTRPLLARYDKERK